MEPDHPATLSLARRRFKHVFVLCTGRCGSVSFAKACSHLTNYTAGHETNRATGHARLDYPEGHIEVDNRLAWFLGGLEERYGDDAFYVHLVRDEAQVAESYDRRWHHRTSLVCSFDRGICAHHEPGPEAATDLVTTVNANIRAFLRHKPHVITGDIDDAKSWFPAWAAAIGAEGNLAAAVAELGVRHNPTRAKDPVAGQDARRDRAAVLSLEKARLQLKLRATRRVTWILAAPWLVLAAPVAVPVAWLAWRSHTKAKAGGTPAGSRWRALFPLRSFRARRTLVYDAFLAHRTKGPERAAAILDRAGKACPPGTRDLFRAMAAGSDDDWLAATNAWAAAASLPEIWLRPGAEPRFQRVEMVAAEPVLARDKVSVIMPAFNAERTIERAARSILSQSWRNLELIIVDDASSDDTAGVARRLAAEDPRVRVLRNPANVGPYVSKNRALLVATGRYVTGHDADDLATPTRITDQMQPLRDDATCVATVASMIRLDRDGVFSYPTKVSSYSHDGIARRAMISLLIDREVLLGQLGFWDTVRFGADSEMLARATTVLGRRLREIRRIVMLCLDIEGSLTNNAEHGISAWEGVSPIRKSYREAWAAWHAATPVAARRLPFPHVPRAFAAPERMLVPEEALQAVVAADGTGIRRAA